MDPIIPKLQKLGGIPFDISVLKSFLSDSAAPLKKANYLEKKGFVIRLRRGLYVVNKEISGKSYSQELIANHLCTPSYVSMRSALRYYGLIPEAVYTTQSVTTVKSMAYSTPLGRFEYIKAGEDYYSIGIRIISSEGMSFLMASPEKALCDFIIFTKGLNLRFKGEILDYLEDDTRLDMDELLKMNPSIIRECAAKGRKGRILNQIAKIIEDGNIR